MTLQPKEKCDELITYFTPYMYCYMGSGMLSNYYDENVVLVNAKKCAIICCNEIIEAIDWHDYETPNSEFEYWKEVISEIEKM